MKTILFTILLSVSFSVNAEGVDCNDIHRLAEAVMESRQLGISITKMMDTDSEMIKSVVIDAYKQPRYTTEDVQNNLIREFANDYYIACKEATR